MQRELQGQHCQGSPSALSKSDEEQQCRSVSALSFHCLVCQGLWTKNTFHFSNRKTPPGRLRLEEAQTLTETLEGQDTWKCCKKRLLFHKHNVASAKATHALQKHRTMRMEETFKIIKCSPFPTQRIKKHFLTSLG